MGLLAVVDGVFCASVDVSPGRRGALQILRIESYQQLWKDRQSERRTSSRVNHRDNRVLYCFPVSLAHPSTLSRGVAISYFVGGSVKGMKMRVVAVCERSFFCPFFSFFVSLRDSVFSHDDTRTVPVEVYVP